MGFESIPKHDEEFVKQIIGAAIDVHRELGPGFLEKIYQKAMAYELSSQGLLIEEEQEILVPYKDIEIPGQRLDLRIGGRIIVELKCVEKIDTHSPSPVTFLLESYQSTTRIVDKLQRAKVK